jgi:pilus assembly protein Flp/PilA
VRREVKKVIEVPRSARGQGLLEYAMIIVLVVLIVIVILAVLGPQVGRLYSNVILKI